MLHNGDYFHCIRFVSALVMMSMACVFRLHAADGGQAGYGMMPRQITVKDAEDAAGVIRKYIKDKRAGIGVAWMSDGKLMSVNNRRRYPMMSVFKLHVAVAVLRKMEREGVSPDTILNISQEQMLKDTYSPLLRLHPDGCFTIPMRELLRYSVAESDNNACDILIGYAGGTDWISREMRSIGVRNFSITETEASMHADRSRCRNNSSTPGSVVRLLRDIYEGGILTGEYARCMEETLLLTATGEDKIKAGLGPGMRLAHKTGSSDRTPEGVKTGDNDAGAVIMPDGRLCYIAVFIKDSEESDAANAAIIAGITKIILSLPEWQTATYR